MMICVLERPSRWRSLWVAGIPLLVYGLWWLFLREPADADVPLTLGVITSFARDAFIAVCAALTGIFRSPWTDDGNFINDASRVIAALAVIAAVVTVVRARRVSPGLLGALVALAVALIGPVLAPGALAFGFRAPEAARYVYPGAVIVLLVLVELVALRRPRDAAEAAERPPPRPAAWLVPVAAAGAAVFVIAMASNVAALIDAGSGFRASSALVEAQFGSFDVAREGRSPAEGAAEQGESVEQSAGLAGADAGVQQSRGGRGGGPRGAGVLRDQGRIRASERRRGGAGGRGADRAEQADRVLVVGVPLTCRRARRGSDGPRSRRDASARGGRRGRADREAAQGPPVVSVGRFSGVPSRRSPGRMARGAHARAARGGAGDGPMAGPRRRGERRARLRKRG